MENPNTSTDRKQSRGIHLNHLNVLLIFIGMVIALFMVFSMYQTSNSFNQIVSVTEAYLSAQQTAGMLNSISVDMAEQCTAFIHSGTPDLTYAYAGQLNAIDGQIEAYAAYADAGESILDDRQVGKALQEGCDDQDNDNGHGDKAQCGGDGTCHPFSAASYKGRNIEGDQTGGALPDGKIIGQILGRGPAAVLDQIALEQRQHGVSAAEVDGADPQEGEV